MRCMLSALTTGVSVRRRPPGGTGKTLALGQARMPRCEPSRAARRARAQVGPRGRGPLLESAAQGMRCSRSDTRERPLPGVAPGAARQEVGTAAAAAAEAQQQQAFRSKRGALAITIIRRSTMRCGKSHPSLSASLCLSLSSVSSPGSFHPDPDGVANAMAWHSSVAGLPRRERAGRRVPQPSSLPTSARPRGSTRVGSNKTKQRTRRPRQAPSSLRVTVAAGDRGRLTAGPGSEGGASARPGS